MDPSLPQHILPVKYIQKDKAKSWLRKNFPDKFKECGFSVGYTDVMTIACY